MENEKREGKIVVFETLAISGIAFQSLITTTPGHIINEP